MIRCALVITKERMEDNYTGLGEILFPVAAGQASSRAELQSATGLSRVTVTQRLNKLFRIGLIVETPETRPSGGRPSRTVRLNPAAGFMLVGDVGERAIRLATVDLDLAVIAQSELSYAPGASPVKTLGRIVAELSRLSRETRTSGPPIGACLSLPAPVDFHGGRVVGPSILTGWDDLDICARLSSALGVPAFIENDVNLMTLCEHRVSHGDTDDFFFIKVGTGIGSGFITGGRLFRGASGAAGDIGHIQFIDDDAPLCRCGKLGCVEARAAGWALARDLTALGLEATDARGVLTHLQAGRPEAIMHLRAASRTIGEVVSDVVSVLNPRTIVLGGTLSEAGQLLASGVRELVYQRCLPLATANLDIRLAEPSSDRALRGAAHLMFELAFSRSEINSAISRLAAAPAQ